MTDTESAPKAGYLVDLNSAEAGGEPFWLDLIPGMRVHCRPAEAWVWSAASARAGRKVRELAKSVDDVTSADTRALLSMPFDKPEVLEGWAEIYYAEALACCVIDDWEGIAIDGDKAPVTPANIESLMRRQGFAVLFKEKYVARASLPAAEGNGSAAAPAGTGAAAPDTADGAGSKASPAPTDGGDAPAPSAPTKNTSPKASKASKSGSS